jgi:hypothetical protein
LWLTFLNNCLLTAKAYRIGIFFTASFNNNAFVMEENRNRNRNQQDAQRPIDTTTDASGLHVQKPPKGAEQMNQSFAKPDPDDLQQQAKNLQNPSENDEEDGHA